MKKLHKYGCYALLAVAVIIVWCWISAIISWDFNVANFDEADRFLVVFGSLITMFYVVVFKMDSYR